MNNKITDKDKKDWENFLSKNESLPNKDLNIKKTTKKNLKLCDLHGYSLDEANRKIDDFIRNSYKDGTTPPAPNIKIFLFVILNCTSFKLSSKPSISVLCPTTSFLCR